MVCTDKCKNAKGLICRCSCDGENHGIHANKDVGKDEEIEEIQEVEKVGGEIIFRYIDPQKSILEFNKILEEKK